MCGHSKTTWQTLEQAVIAVVARGVVQLEFKVDYMEWEHDDYRGEQPALQLLCAKRGEIEVNLLPPCRDCLFVHLL